MNEQECLLVIVLDVSPSGKLMSKGDQAITHCLNGVMVACNSHLMMNAKNQLAVIACHANKSSFLYPDDNKDEDIKHNGGQYESFTEVNTSIYERLKTLILDSRGEAIHTESLLAGAMCMALCYVNRICREKRNQQARIIVFTSSGEISSQYMNFMNVFFTAQKQGVTIDACALERDSSLLQQGCDITSGIYLKIPNISAFLQYVLCVFLPDPETRDKMVLPARTHVDYRAACFCHRNLIEIGYVCSVCLSIFCSFSPICSTCQTAFKFLGPPPANRTKKKRQRLY